MSCLRLNLFSASLVDCHSSGLLRRWVSFWRGRFTCWHLRRRVFGTRDESLSLFEFFERARFTHDQGRFYFDFGRKNKNREALIIPSTSAPPLNQFIRSTHRVRCVIC